jgi:hypothetical protein
VRLALEAALRRHARDNQIDQFLRSFLIDDVHPNAHGHAMIGQLVAYAISEAVKVGRAGGSSCEEGPSDQARVAPAVQKRVCAFGEELTPFVHRAEGWSYGVERSRAGHPKPGYIATSPGATLQLCARRPTNPRFEPAVLSVAYLQSWQGMGTALVRCTGSCHCRPTTWNGHIERRVSQPQFGAVNIVHRKRRGAEQGQLTLTERACGCKVRLSVLNETRSGGHKFKLVALFSGFYLYHGGYVMCGSGGNCADVE